MITISSRELNQDVTRAKKASRQGPVIITDRGKPAHVLLSIQDYEKLIGQKKSITELLAMPATCDIDFDPQPIHFESKPADLA